jgi:hypothetical protein
VQTFSFKLNDMLSLKKMVLKTLNRYFSPILDRYQQETNNHFHSLTKQINKFIMDTQETLLAGFKAVLTRIDTDTNNISNDIKGWKDKVTGQGLPASVEADLLASFEAAAKKLEGVGKEDVPITSADPTTPPTTAG